MLIKLKSWLRDLSLFMKNNFGFANLGYHLRFGQVKGIQLNVGHCVWAASQVVGNRSGKFVYENAGALTLCVDATAYIFGWAQERARTPTVGDTCTVNIALDAIFRIPVNSGTYAEAMRGDLCDISVSSSVQGAQLDASDENSLIVCDGDLVNNEWVDVKINPAVQGAAAGVDD